MFGLFGFIRGREGDDAEIKGKNHFLTETLEGNDSIQAKQSLICDGTLVMQEGASVGSVISVGSAIYVDGSSQLKM
jgi:hypothetical protein